MTPTTTSTTPNPNNRNSTLSNHGPDHADDDLMSKIREPLREALSAIEQKGQELMDEMSKLADKVKQNPLPAVLTGVGVLALAGGITGILLYRAHQRNRPFAWLRQIF